MILKIILTILIFTVGITIDYLVRKLSTLFATVGYFIHFKEKVFTKEDEKRLEEDLAKMNPQFVKKQKFIIR